MKFGKYLLFGVVFIVVASPTSVFPQAYVQYMQGIWTADGKEVLCGTELSENTLVKNISGKPSDLLKIADPQGDITLTCIKEKECRVPITKVNVFGEFLNLVVKWWNKNGKEYCTVATKGTCDNYDGIVAFEQGSFDDDQIKILWGEKGEIVLRGGKEKYSIGVNEIRIGSSMSRVLILPKEIYEKENINYVGLKQKVKYWREKGVSKCSIKGFMEAYIDLVANKYKTELEKYDQQAANKK